MEGLSQPRLLEGEADVQAGYQGWQQEQHLGMQHSSHALGVNVNGAELQGEMIKFFE